MQFQILDHVYPSSQSHDNNSDKSINFVHIALTVFFFVLFF